jgi:hypothetical protein
MEHAAVAGVSRLAAVVGALVSLALVILLARLLARRSGRSERTLVSLSGRD